MTTPYYSGEYVNLYHGDCRDIPEWHAADCSVTDPPYGINWRRGENKRRRCRSHDGIAHDTDTAARDAALAAMTGKPAVVFGSLYAPFPADLRQVLIYSKPADAASKSRNGTARSSQPASTKARYYSAREFTVTEYRH